MKGVLITLEGNEGSGKTTQIKLLTAHLKKKGRRVFTTREPGGTAIGDSIRSILLDPRHTCMSALTETMLYMASRAQLVEEVILPRLKKGEVVLCDRWLDATLAYQGYAGGVPVKWIKELGKTATHGVTPALSLYLDLPVAVGLRRARSSSGPDRIESKALSFHKKVRAGFLRITDRKSTRLNSSH